MDEIDRLLTADQLADRWAVSSAHVWRLAREGHLPAVHIGRYIRFRPDVIERFEMDGGYRPGGEDA